MAAARQSEACRRSDCMAMTMTVTVTVTVTVGHAGVRQDGRGASCCGRGQRQ
jgi:hypothetical protein